MGISQSGSILISHNMNKDPKFDRAVICKLTLLIGVISMQIIGIPYSHAIVVPNNFDAHIIKV